MHSSLGDDVVFLIRQHGLVRSRVEIPEELATSVKDVSAYPEIQELFLASDVLVTDYSSVFFDFACLRRPIIFYAYDLEAYRDELRGFYLDYETELPGPIVTTREGAVRRAAVPRHGDRASSAHGTTHSSSGSARATTARRPGVWSTRCSRTARKGKERP